MTTDESIYINIKDGKAELTPFAKKLINVGIAVIGSVEFFYIEGKEVPQPSMVIDKHGKLKKAGE